MAAYLPAAQHLPWPLDWEAAFGRVAPLRLEIGIGNGQFLVGLARQFSDDNIIGLDISIPSVRRALKRIRRAHLENVRLLNCAAEYALWALMSPDTLHGVHINFPDPWPKAAHHHRRLINPTFLHLLASRLIPGAPLDIATDHTAYATVIEAALLETPYFDSRLPTIYVTEDTARTRTKYEQTALLEGRTCYYFKWRRNQHPIAHAFPIPLEFTMPHAVMRCPLALNEIGARFTPQAFEDADVKGRFVELFHAERGNSLLIDTYISEEPVSQRVALMVRAARDEPGKLILSVHEMGFPRATAGLHGALRALANWLQSLHADIEMMESNLQG